MTDNGLTKERQLARGLGWFSIGLGVTQMLAPRLLTRAMGVKPHPWLFRLLGMREIASGVAILIRRQPGPAVVSRVAGDAMDLTMLGVAMLNGNNQRGRVALATAAVAGVTALDVRCSQQLNRGADGRAGVIQFRRSIVINRSPEEVYGFWRNFENLPRFMNHLKSVTVLDGNRSHWVAKGPRNMDVKWDAEMISDIPNRSIAWRSLPGSTVYNQGAVLFELATGGRGTLLRVNMEYRPPAGVLGAAVAKLFGEAPEKQIKVDLHRFKQLLETGEIARTGGQPAGRERSTSRRFDDFVQKGV